MVDPSTAGPSRAFAAMIAALPRGSANISIDEWSGGIANLFRRRGGEAELSKRLGFVPPEEPRVEVHGPQRIVATGPGAWLLLHDAAPLGWVEQTETAFAASASVVDQSSAYAILSLSGPDVWRLLAKGAFVDLHPDSFGPGSAAVTLIAHIGVILWRRPDRDTFEVAVFRSHAASFWHWLVTAAEAEGWSLARGGGAG